MTLPFSLPPVTPGGVIPTWQGTAFQIGDEVKKILQYSVNSKGWNDDLTFFHEETAGDQHFIDCASRDHAILELKKHIKHSNVTILEIGCSSGFMLKRMQKNFPQAIIMGSDIVFEPLQQLSVDLPTVPLFRFDLMNCPFPDHCLDAVVLLNVLEHIEDDFAALKQIHRILKPGGIAVIEVPAGPHLFDIYDKVLMHYRRYHLNNLQNMLTHIGFSIQKKSHLGFFLYPAFWMVKQRNKRLLSKPETDQKRYVEQTIRNTGESKLMHVLMQTELFLGRFVNYPFGIRCLIVCRK